MITMIVCLECYIYTYISTHSSFAQFEVRSNDVLVLLPRLFSDAYQMAINKNLAPANQYERKINRNISTPPNLYLNTVVKPIQRRQQSRTGNGQRGSVHSNTKTSESPRKHPTKTTTMLIKQRRSYTDPIRLSLSD